MIFSKKDNGPFRVFGHPLHVPLTHFPLALWTFAFVGDGIFCWQGNLFWWKFAFWNIALGLAVGSLTIWTGFMDYIFIPENKSFTERTANWHMTVMLLAVCLFGVSLYFHAGAPVPSPFQRTLAIAFSGTGTLCLQIGGWLGGQLVYHHGMGYDE